MQRVYPVAKPSDRTPGSSGPVHKKTSPAWEAGEVLHSVNRRDRRGIARRIARRDSDVGVRFGIGVSFSTALRRGSRRGLTALLLALTALLLLALAALLLALTALLLALAALLLADSRIAAALDRCARSGLDTARHQGFTRGEVVTARRGATVRFDSTTVVDGTAVDDHAAADRTATAGVTMHRLRRAAVRPAMMALMTAAGEESAAATAVMTAFDATAVAPVMAVLGAGAAAAIKQAAEQTAATAMVAMMAAVGNAAAAAGRHVMAASVNAAAIATSFGRFGHGQGRTDQQCEHGNNTHTSPIH